jgi:hypothetical protein
MNFVRESVFAGPMRNSGSAWRSAFAGTNGSQPGSERVANELGSNDGEILEESLGDDAGLDEGMSSDHNMLPGQSGHQRTAELASDPSHENAHWSTLVNRQIAGLRQQSASGVPRRKARLFDTPVNP